MLGGSDNTGGLDEEIVVRQALERLPEHYREIILPRFADGLQFDEIAQVQGQSLEATNPCSGERRNATKAGDQCMSNLI
jgi:hypothetical protein